MSLLGRIGIFLFACAIALISLGMAQSARERSFVGTWRLVNSPSYEGPAPFICGRECTITLDGNALVVKTRAESETYIPGRPTKKTVELSNTITIEITTVTEWDKSTLVITRTATSAGSQSVSKLTSRLTVQGDRLIIEVTPRQDRSGSGKSEFTYTRVK